MASRNYHNRILHSRAFKPSAGAILRFEGVGDACSRPDKTGGTGARDRRRRFARGRSGNPAGCAAAATTSTALLAGEGEALTHKAVELALAGDRRHYGLCLERILGPIVNAGSNSRCRQSATPPIWRGQRVKADPTEAGKISTLRWSRESDARPKIAPFAMYSPRMSVLNRLTMDDGRAE